MYRIVMLLACLVFFLFHAGCDVNLEPSKRPPATPGGSSRSPPRHRGAGLFPGIARGGVYHRTELHRRRRDDAEDDLRGVGRSWHEFVSQASATLAVFACFAYVALRAARDQVIHAAAAITDTTVDLPVEAPIQTLQSALSHHWPSGDVRGRICQLCTDSPSVAEISANLDLPLGVADVKRAGTDLTIVAHGRAVIQSLQVAEILAKEHQVSAEVVDLRSIRPLDEATILASVRKTHRVLLVDENKPFCGVGAQIAYLIQDQAFDDLDAPIKRVSAIDAPQIYSPPMEKEQMPNPQRILQAALGVLA